MVEINNKDIWKVDIYYGTTWVWLKGTNSYIPKFKGEMLGYHMLYRYNNTIVAQPFEIELYNKV